jgi:hypothetical protein
MDDRPAFGANLANRIIDRELKQARAILAAIGVASLVAGAVTLSDLRHQMAAFSAHLVASDLRLVQHLELVAKIGIAVAVVYLVCAFLVTRKPVLATGAGLLLFAGTIVAQAVVDVSSLFDVFGLGIRIAILIGLVSAVHFARIYERNRRKVAELPKAMIAS